MVKKLSHEEWKPLFFSGWKELRYRYAVSSAGRIASFKKDITDGKLLNGSLTTGYRTLNLHRPGNKGTLYIHREIAKAFLKKPSSKHKYVIHKNHNKLDNQMASENGGDLHMVKAVIKHQQKSPAKIAYKKVQANRTVGLKLNAGQVRTIKKILNNPRRKITISQLANKYKVSEMTIYRIRNGENWKRI